MSHFTVLVIGENPEEQLAPFDENLDTARYVAYTREQLIKKERESIREYNAGLYAEFLADPNGYKEKHGGNEAHIKYLEVEFPLMLTWTDDQIYEYAIRYYDADEIGPNGEVYSTRNPNSKWDWYSLGGRWSGMLKVKEGATIATVGRPGVFANETGIDSALKKDILNLNDLNTFAVLKDGQWYERGKMCWWAIVVDEKKDGQWDEEFKKLIADLSDETLLSIYDCHI
jgi:hypothetical protein